MITFDGSLFVSGISYDFTCGASEFFSNASTNF